MQVLAFIILLYNPIASVIFNDALSSRTSSIVPLSKQRHERKEHSQCRMALNGRLIYRAYCTWKILLSWTGGVVVCLDHPTTADREKIVVIVGGKRASSIIQHVGCINIFFLPIKDTRNYGAFEQEHVRHFCEVDTSQRHLRMPGCGVDRVSQRLFCHRRVAVALLDEIRGSECRARSCRKKKEVEIMIRFEKLVTWSKLFQHLLECLYEMFLVLQSDLHNRIIHIWCQLARF